MCTMPLSENYGALVYEKPLSLQTVGNPGQHTLAPPRLARAFQTVVSKQVLSK